MSEQTGRAEAGPRMRRHVTAEPVCRTSDVDSIIISGYPEQLRPLKPSARRLHLSPIPNLSSFEVQLPLPTSCCPLASPALACVPPSSSSPPSLALPLSTASGPTPLLPRTSSLQWPCTVSMVPMPTLWYAPALLPVPLNNYIPAFPMVRSSFFTQAKTQSGVKSKIG